MDRFRGGLVSLAVALALGVGGCQGYSSVNGEVVKIGTYVRKARENPKDISVYLDRTKRLLGFGADVSSIEVYGAKKKGDAYTLMVRGKEEDTFIVYVDKDGKNGYDEKSSLTIPHKLDVIVPERKKRVRKVKKYLI